MKKNRNIITYLQQGFTLMEVMVAVSIFTIIVTMGIVALLTINNTYKKSQVERQTVDNITFVLETMSRSLRTAAKWEPVTLPGSITFTDQDGVEIITYEQGTITTPLGQMGTIMRTDDQGTYPVVSENIDIQEFILTPSGGNLQDQSYLQIFIKGVMKNGIQETNFSVQTSVSRRSLDQ